MTRKRSLSDLYRISRYASDRLYRGTGKRGGLSDKVVDIANRYASNIENSKQYRRADQMFMNMQRRGATYEQLSAFENREFNRPYSANTYKGVIAG